VRALGLDIGEKRIGVAVSDAQGRVATPLKVLDARRTLGDGVELRRLIDEYEAELLVVGLPLSLDGTEGPQARRVRSAAAKLSVLAPLEMVFADERLSSAEAKRRMREAGTSERDQRGSVDMIAASLFLQAYLDARNEAQATSAGGDA